MEACYLSRVLFLEPLALAVEIDLFARVILNMYQVGKRKRRELNYVFQEEKEHKQTTFVSLKPWPVFMQTIEFLF